MAVREVSVVGEESPAAEDMARFSAAVRQFAVQHNRAPYEVDATAEQLRMWQNVLQYRTQELAAQLQAARKELVAAKTELAEAEQRSIAAPPQVSLWRRLLNFSKKGNECPSTGCTKTQHSSGRN
jgi:alanyl-tRNA synthetase